MLISIGVVLYSLGIVMVRASAVSGAVFSFWRLWMGAAAFVVLTFISSRRTPLIMTREGWRHTILGGATFAGHQLLYFTAVKMTSVADVTLVSATAPLVTALFAVPMFGERPGRGFFGWVVVAMIGAGTVVYSGSVGIAGAPRGMLLALGHVVVFALFFLISKQGRNVVGVLPFLTGTMLVSAALMSVYVAVVGEPVGGASRRDLMLCATVAFGPGLLGHVVMTWPLRWVPANIPPVMRLGQPVLASLAAWLWLGERVEMFHVIGGTIVIGAVIGAIVSRSGRALLAAEQGEVLPFADP